MQNVVIAGAGQAGFSVASKLRSLGFEGRITMVGNETVPPYQRPPLSKKYLMGELDLERLFLRPDTFYPDHNINLKLDETILSVDAKVRTLRTNKADIGYDDLVVATGSTPRRLPAAIGGDLNGVHVVRTLQDVDAMAPEFVKDRRVLIVGGGYIGLEAAAVAASMGLKVDLVEASERILNRVAARETADFFRNLHQVHGVAIHENSGVDRLEGNGYVARAILSNGDQIETDFVVVGIGVTPAIEFMDSTGAIIENGLKTDAYGRTSVPDIWAVGDCASFPFKGQRVRLESVPNAIDQGEAVAANILGAGKEYIAKPWFWSDQFDVKLQIAGLNAGFDNVVTRRGDGDGVSFWYYRGDQLLAVDAMNAPRDYMVGKRLIESGKSPQKEKVADPSSSAKSLMAG